MGWGWGGGSNVPLYYWWRRSHQNESETWLRPKALEWLPCIVLNQIHIFRARLLMIFIYHFTIKNKIKNLISQDLVNRLSRQFITDIPSFRFVLIGTLRHNKILGQSPWSMTVCLVWQSVLLGNGCFEHILLNYLKGSETSSGNLLVPVFIYNKMACKLTNY